MKKNEPIGLACDHAGYELKEALRGYLQGSGYTVVDYGTYSPASVDYPDYAQRLADGLGRGEVRCGVAMCGTGNGISMALNRHHGVRAALCWHPELARLARAHNDANVVSLPARFVSYDEATAIVSAFLGGVFEGGRHQRRIDKLG